MFYQHIGHCAALRPADNTTVVLRYTTDMRTHDISLHNLSKSCIRMKSQDKKMTVAILVSTAVTVVLQVQSVVRTIASVLTTIWVTATTMYAAVCQNNMTPPITPGHK